MQKLITLMLELSFLRFATETIILPALPLLAISLHTSRTNAQLLVVAFMAGLILTKCILILGGVARLGYRKALLVMLPIFLLGSLIGSMHFMWAVALGRFFQGVGLGGITTIQTGLMKQSLGDQFLKLWAGLKKYASLFPYLGALLGTLLLYFFNWSSLFIFILVCGLLIYVHLINALSKVSNQAESLSLPFATLKTLGSRTDYFSAVLMFSFLYAGEAVFYTISPFLFIKDFNWSPHQYSLVVLVFVIGLFLGNYSIQKIKSVNQSWITQIGLAAALFTGLFFLACDFFNWRHPLLAVGVFFIFSYASSLLEPITRGNITKMFPDIVTPAIGLFSLFFSLAACGLSALSAHIAHIDFFSLGILYTAIAALSIASYLTHLASKRKNRS